MPKKPRTPPEPELPRWYRGADIPMSVIRRYARAVAKHFQPEKIVLFGSYAYGTPHADSDVDILVIMPARNELDQAVRIDRAVEAPFPLDLIVRTPKNMAWRLEEGDSFLREIMAKGKVLYYAGTHEPQASLKRQRRTTPSLALQAHRPLSSRRHMKKQTAEWVRKAEADYRLAAKLARGKEPFHDQLCFHCQQAVEKYLKALLVELGQPVPRTHVLADLVDLLLPHHPSFRPLRRRVSFLTRFAVEIRYPHKTATKQQSRSALRWATEASQEARSLLGIRLRRPRRHKPR